MQAAEQLLKDRLQVYTNGLLRRWADTARDLPEIYMVRSASWFGDLQRL